MTSPLRATSEEMDVWALRRAVGLWLRLKSEYPYSPGQKVATDALVAGGAKAMYRQLAADADHSDLLVRLLRGEEPRIRP